MELAIVSPVQQIQRCVTNGRLITQQSLVETKLDYFVLILEFKICQWNRKPIKSLKLPSDKFVKFFPISCFYQCHACSLTDTSFKGSDYILMLCLNFHLLNFTLVFEFISTTWLNVLGSTIQADWLRANAAAVSDNKTVVIQSHCATRSIFQFLNV